MYEFPKQKMHDLSFYANFNNGWIHSYVIKMFHLKPKEHLNNFV